MTKFLLLLGLCGLFSGCANSVFCKAKADNDGYEVELTYTVNLGDRK